MYDIKTCVGHSKKYVTIDKIIYSLFFVNI